MCAIRPTVFRLYTRTHCRIDAIVRRGSSAVYQVVILSCSGVGEDVECGLRSAVFDGVGGEVQASEAAEREAHVVYGSVGRELEGGVVVGEGG